MPSLQKNKRLVLLSVLVLSLAGCADYMNRRDSVSAGIGNATEANTAIHTINPQPPIAYKRLSEN